MSDIQSPGSPIRRSGKTGPDQEGPVQGGPEPLAGPASPPAHAPGAARTPRPPRAARVLAVWGAASLLTLLMLRLGAQDTPVTPWAGPAPSWSEHLSFWDAGWYERIFREGYPAILPEGGGGAVAQNSWAFMPLLPLLATPLTWLGLPFYPAAALVAITASGAGAVIMDRWLAPRVGGAPSLWGVALTWTSMCAAVLQVPYAESLGLVLVAGALMAAERGRFAVSALLIMVGSVARPIGLPLALALGLWWLWEMAAARGHDGPSDGPGDDPGELGGAGGRARAWARRLGPTWARLGGRERAGLAALTALALVSALVWPVAAWVATGRMDAYTATETSWRGGGLVPFLPWLDRGQWWVGEHLGWLLVACALALAALGLASRASRSLGPAAWFWCVAYALYLLAFFDPTTSLLRILLPLAPLAWAAAASVGRRGRWALAVAGVMAQAFWISWVWDLSSAITWVP
ncbi:hypothetical protein [Actinomyces marmotae]|uniref:hypothetical protein n=1 Tax=Actinomyces marmotae TaxID=2737173 RepID=UPI001F296899|nr:hypothetical protein [Actinomyces marmotae]